MKFGCNLLITIWLQISCLYSASTQVIDEKPFVVVIASYNNKKFYERNLDSVFSQKYNNYRVIYLDDASTDGTAKLVKKYIKKHKLKSKITLIENQNRLTALANLYKGIHLCKPDEIVAILDGDDWLSNEHVLERVNQEYSDPEVWLTYGQFDWYFGENAKRLPGICKKLPSEVVENNGIRSYNKWVTSHLKTFHAGLFHQIKKEDLFYQEDFFKSTADVAIMLPLLELAGKHSRFIPDILYVYNRTTPINDDKVNLPLQVEMTKEIYSRASYAPAKSYILNQKIESKPIIDLCDSNITLSESNRYERPNFIWMTQGKNSDVIVVTDFNLKRVGKAKEVGYKKVVAYLMEPRAIYPWTYAYVEDHAEKFDLILTYDKELLDKFPNRCKFVHAIGYGTLNHHGIHKKTKLCSIMAGKNTTEGHQLRHLALERYKNYFEGYKGYDTPYAQWKDPWLNDFYFSVIIENSRAAYYFTEKITECFRAGTIPIYWGCPTIGEFFDSEGIIVFDNLEELGEILKNLSIEEYHKRLPSVQRNFEIASKFPQHNFVHRPEQADSLDVIWLHIKDFFDK